jgi:diguanylate cyclase (GGDEF)-like protein
VRGNDMVSRIGGDEFACLLVDVPARHQIGRLACKLFDAVSAPFMLHTLKLTMRPSIGNAVSPSDGTTAEALLKSADGAMYRAKQEGSGYAFCAGPAER